MLLDKEAERKGAIFKLGDLEKRVRKLHNNVNSEYCKKLNASMPARCADMFKNDGKFSSYK